MLALMAAGALAHPCRAPLVHGPRVPAPIVFGAGLSWQVSSLLYNSSDGTLAVLDRRTVDLTHLALPRRWPLDRPHAEWRQRF